MSAGILEHDIITATEPTWHRREEIKKVITFENSGLDWEVLSRPVYGQNADGDINPEPIAGYQEIVSFSTDGSPIHLSLMKARYATIQTKTIWDAMEKSLAGIPCVVTCTGSLQNRKLVFISVRLTGKGKEGFIVNGDKFKSNLNFLSSNDGSCVFMIFDSNTRVVCENTFNMAMSTISDSQLRHSARHTKNNQLKIDNMVGAIAKTLESRKLFVAECESLFKKKISQDEAYAWAVGFGFPSHREKPSAQVISNAEGIAAAFRSGEGNNGKNRYDLFNGVTQFYTRNTTRSDSDTYQSSFVGLGATRKGQAFDSLRCEESYRKALRNGEKGLALLS